MTAHHSPIDRRTALRTLVSGAVVGASGCLSEDRQGNPGTGSATSDGTAVGPFQALGVEGTTLVVELASDAELDQVNLIQPNGELWGSRGIATGAEQVSFELRGGYTPGEYDVVGVYGNETVVETSLEIRPELKILEVGLYRNHPEKPWEEVYGESDTNRLINGQAFVAVKNSGTGPEVVTQLTFTGDVPNPLENPRGSGIYDKEHAVIPPDETIDLFSSSLPFGAETENGMGCSPDGNSGEFTVSLETSVTDPPVNQVYNVHYSGSTDMTDCKIAISESNDG